MDALQVAAAAGALALVPANQGRLFRLSILAALAAEAPPGHAGGGIDQQRLQALVNRGDLAAVAAQQEDPLEDIMTEEFAYYGGSYLVGSGIAQDSTYVLRLAVRGLLLSDALPADVRSELSELAQSVLALSDHTLRGANLVRYQVPPTDASRGVDVPGQSRLRRAIGSMTFTSASLDQLEGVTAAALEPLILDAGKKRFNDAALVEGGADQWPLLRFNDQIAVAKPLDLALALRHRILCRAVEATDESAVAEAFGAAVDDDVVTSLRHLHLRPKLRARRSSDRPWTEVTVQMDTDVVLLCLICSDSMENIAATPYGVYETRHLLGDLHARLEAAADEADGELLGLIIGEAAGRSAFFGLQETDRTNLTLEFMSAADFEILAMAEQGDALALWKFSRASADLRDDVQIQHFSTLDLYSIYRDHERGLAPFREATLLTVAPGSAFELRCRVKRRRDRHGAFYVDRTIREVERDDEQGLGDHLYRLAEIHEPRVIRYVSAAPLDLWIAGPEAEASVGRWWHLVETVAYWLDQLAAPLLDRLESLSRAIPCAQLEIEVDHPAYWLEGGPDPGGTGLGTCILNPYGATVKLGPDIRRLMARPDNEADRALVAVIVDVLDELCQSHGASEMAATDKHAARESVARLGLKKHLVGFPYVGNELLMPADGPPRLVQEADITAARDRLGAHLVAKFGIRGAPVPPDLRTDVLRATVEFLMDDVSGLLDATQHEDLVERLLGANERIIARGELDRAILPARAATYPDAVDQEHLRTDLARSSQAAVCCRFLAEYVAARPPKGSERWSLRRYDRAMSLVAEALDWAYLSDALHYGMSDAQLLINDDGQLRLQSYDRYELGRAAYFDQHVSAQRDASERLFADRFESGTEPEDAGSDPNGASTKPESSRIVERLNPLMSAEAGMSVTELGELLHAASGYALQLDAQVVAVGREEACEALVDELGWETSKVEAGLAYLTITERAVFLTPPDGDWHDVVPWRFSRRWSLNRRPFVERDGSLIWGRRQVLVALMVMLGQLLSGRYQALARTPELLAELGRLADETGHEFEHKVAAEFRAHDRFEVEESISSIGGHRLERENGDTLGDIDVLAADTTTRVLYAVECKDLAGALTPSEVAGELSEHFDADAGTSTSKHLERMAWLESHQADVLRHFHISDDSSKWRTKGTFVTGRLVMAPYIRDVTFEIVAFKDLPRWISRLPARQKALRKTKARRS